MNRPDLWVVTELYYPEETSTGHILTGIAEGLARQYRVAVICSQPTYSARGVRAARREVRNGVTIYRTRNTRFDPRVLPFRLLNAVTISVAMFFNVLRRVRRGEQVLVVTNPPTLPLMVRAAARLKRAHCLLLVHDVYPEALAAAGMLSSSSVSYSILAALMRRIYRGFDRVVVLGRDMYDLVARKLADTRVLRIIPNWADCDQIYPLKGSNELREQLGLTGKFVVQYAGNIGRTHGIDSLLAAAKELRNDPSIHFLIIGSGARQSTIEKGIADGDLPNMTLHAPIPRAQMLIPHNACDVVVITFMPGMKGVSVPSRTYNVLASGKPILAMAEADSELGLIVEEEKVGWVVPPGDPGALVHAILAARNDSSGLAAMGERARTAAERRYAPEIVLQAWISLLQEPK